MEFPLLEACLPKRELVCIPSQCRNAYSCRKIRHQQSSWVVHDRSPARAYYFSPYMPWLRHRLAELADQILHAACGQRFRAFWRENRHPDGLEIEALGLFFKLTTTAICPASMSRWGEFDGNGKEPFVVVGFSMQSHTRTEGSINSNCFLKIKSGFNTKKALRLPS